MFTLLQYVSIFDIIAIMKHLDVLLIEDVHDAMKEIHVSGTRDEWSHKTHYGREASYLLHIFESKKHVKTYE